MCQTAENSSAPTPRKEGLLLPRDERQGGEAGRHVIMPVQSAVQSTTRPENVYERLDSSIPSLVQRLFPTQSCALHYLVGLLAHAHVKQYALPTISRETEGDVAIVCVKDYQELRRLLRLAYETAHMYTLIFEALGLLKVQRCKGQLNLVIPLRPYHPPTELLSKLGQLREHYRSHRPHVGRLVETVIERLGDLERDEMQQLHGAQDAFSAELVDLIEQALAAEGVQGETRQIAQRIAANTLHHFLVEKGQTTSTMVKAVRKNLPAQAQEDSVREARSHEGSPSIPLNREEKGVPMHQARRNLHVQDARIDSLRDESIPLARRAQEKGRFRDEDLLAACQGEAVTARTPRSAHAFVTSNLPASVDSAQPFPLRIGNGQKYYNKSLVSDSVPDSHRSKEERKRPASQPFPLSGILAQTTKLAMFIEGDAKNERAYIKLIKNHPEQRRLAALIATLIRKHYPQGKGPLDRPGGYFTRRCQEYEETGIPDEFSELMTCCDQMPYRELEEEVKRAFQHLASITHRSLSRSTESSLFKPKRGPVMDQATAEALARRIPLEDPYVQVRGVSRAQEGSYVVEVFIDPVEYRFGSIEDWEAYHAQMQELEQEGETR